ncbi:MAG: class I SAM-dependent methyltransferase [Gammaproteobacteria bacterium]
MPEEVPSKGVIERIKAKAQSEAKVWVDSAYYKNAETWTHIFWGRDWRFIELFKQLRLDNVLKLACGHGRHSEHVLRHYHGQIRKMTCMDVNQENIEFCGKRLREWLASGMVELQKNNGIDFQPIAAESVTSIFCYDAMVHFDKEVVAAYLRDAFRVLKSGGLGLFHHSNYSKDPDIHFGKKPHARNFMSKELFADCARKARLEIVTQKVIPWGGWLTMTALRSYESRTNIVRRQSGA